MSSKFGVVALLGPRKNSRIELDGGLRVVRKMLGGMVCARMWAGPPWNCGSPDPFLSQPSWRRNFLTHLSFGSLRPIIEDQLEGSRPEIARASTLPCLTGWSIHFFNKSPFYRSCQSFSDHTNLIDDSRLSGLDGGSLGIEHALLQIHLDVVCLCVLCLFMNSTPPLMH